MFFVKILIFATIIVSLRICNAITNLTSAESSDHLTWNTTTTSNDSLHLSNLVIESENQFQEWIYLVLHYTKLLYMVLGIVTNSLAFGVFYTRNKRNFTSANVYFMTLSVADGLACLMLNVIKFFDELKPSLNLI